ncbi:MAG TPA: recombinase family protein [Amycolatopsis sp.]|nr:recombinase family protein [Amycolatopsis sp.]
MALYLVGGAVTSAVRSCLDAHSSWTLVHAPYCDPKGPLADRPALRRALADARVGVFDLLLVDRVSQLSRSIDELADILDALDAAGVALHSAAEPTLASETPAGLMFLHVLARMAEAERDRVASKRARWFRCRRAR